MTATALLAELRAAGATLAMNGDRLKVVAGLGILTPSLVLRLKAAKPELMAILAGNHAVNETDTKPADDPTGFDRCIELDRIICEICAAARFTDDVREMMLATRRRMSPDNIRKELPITRGYLEDAEREAAAAIRRARRC